MTEAEARRLLRRFDGVGGVEVWISLQRWRAAPDGWSVTQDLEGWRFRLSRDLGGLRLSATAPGGGPPVVWRVAAVARA